MIDATVVSKLKYISYESSVSYELKTKELENHDDAVPDGYKFTSIDDADEQTVGHDWSDLDEWITT